MSSYTYVEKPNPNLVCCICCNPFVDPITSNSCHHTFCRDCISQALQVSKQCPIDRSPLSQRDLTPAHPIVRSLVDELLVECTHKSEGCSHTCQRELLASHVRSNCWYAPAHPSTPPLRYTASPEPARSPERASMAPVIAVHNATCNFCRNAIVGTRYKCLNCPDFDTCESCYSITPEQHPKHGFVRVTNPDDYLSARPSPNFLHAARCDACDMPVVGVRFKCTYPGCLDFDLCENCEALPIPVHPITHHLLKIKSVNERVPVALPAPRRQSSIGYSGCW